VIMDSENGFILVFDREGSVAHVEPAPSHETRDERIRREDREFDLYGRLLLQKWIDLGLPQAVHSHRTRRTRGKATRIGKWLCEPAVLAWLDRYNISLDTFLDVTHTRHIQGRQDTVESYTTVLCGRGAQGQGGYRWEVRIEGPFPGMFGNWDV